MDSGISLGHYLRFDAHPVLLEVAREYAGSCYSNSPPATGALFSNDNVILFSLIVNHPLHIDLHFCQCKLLKLHVEILWQLCI